MLKSWSRRRCWIVEKQSYIMNLRIPSPLVLWTPVLWHFVTNGKELFNFFWDTVINIYRYIDYGEPTWKEQARKVLSGLKWLVLCKELQLYSITCTLLLKLFWRSAAQFWGNFRLASRACLFTFLWSWYQNSLGQAICHWISIRFDHIHGILHSGLSPSRRCYWWLQTRASRHKVRILCVFLQKWLYHNK